ncbi:hypothetical protein AC578_3820 [Pseudocercospora eumusae]|uniref:Uncharacterized protein n=1 Tax=Pseudocercospora eumusae TaxID=321146 RepID=A0A139HFI0_9PEZI|nr:hypothetical protein AC578_3820 [Pseudocercospora eumusae]
MFDSVAFVLKLYFRVPRSCRLWPSQIKAQAGEFIVQLQTNIDNTKTNPGLNTETTSYERLNIILEDTAKRSQESGKTEIEDTCHWLLREFDNKATPKVDVVDNVMLELLAQLCEERLPEENSGILKNRLVGFCEIVRAAQDQDKEEVPENVRGTIEATLQETEVRK